MTDDIKQDNDSSSTPGEGIEFAGRRKVIKGLATAVPVIITVTHGEAAAAASFYQCVGKPEGTNPPEWIEADETDIWYRELQEFDVDENGDPILKKRLIYANLNGEIVQPVDGGMPFTPSCHNSFL